ncbi:MAG TPA: CHAD domain-containing protein [Phototrophicaceae bacterium]|nr:CHAD domain-containing protein [Phototrophicaceae bacterium]
MSTDHTELLQGLQAQSQPIDPSDPMAEAGRKALLADFIKMLEHEAGSRSGDDPEDVHDMRVSTRRMRSTLRLLADYYKPKAIQPYLDELKKIAGLLGAVRDLDVMLADLQAYQASLDPGQQPPFQLIFDLLTDQRAKARKDLIRALDKGGYDHFVQDFSEFVAKAGKGAYAIDLEDVHPYQVRHLLPQLVYEHLAAVRAYDAALADADLPTLHALRIEFKRLRYAVSIFADVLGKSGTEFTDELKAIQDHLGRLVDYHVAAERLHEIIAALDPDKQADSIAVLQGYIDHLDAESKTLRAGFDEVWKHFNTKSVQRSLANALAIV